MPAERRAAGDDPAPDPALGRRPTAAPTTTARPSRSPSPRPARTRSSTPTARGTQRSRCGRRSVDGVGDGRRSATGAHGVSRGAATAAAGSRSCASSWMMCRSRRGGSGPTVKLHAAPEGRAMMPELARLSLESQGDVELAQRRRRGRRLERRRAEPAAARRSLEQGARPRPRPERDQLHRQLGNQPDLRCGGAPAQPPPGAAAGGHAATPSSARCSPPSPWSESVPIDRGDGRGPARGRRRRLVAGAARLSMTLSV